MNKLARTLSVLLCTSILAFGQGKGLLWKVEKKGQKTSYLFGTIHIIPAAKFKISPGLEKALTECDELVLEADLSDQSAVMAAMKFAQLPNGGKIDTMLSAEEYALLDSALIANVGMGLAGFVSFKPFFIQSLFASTLVKDNPTIIELELTRRIKEQEKPLFTLETLEEQMVIFDSIPYRKQMEGLIEMLEETGSLQTEYDKLLRLYLDEDLDQLGEYMTTTLDDAETIYYLLAKRNRKWLPILAERTTEKSLLIAVGAGHLSGETGLISLLEAEGFKVRPVE
jgi:uncharacterized protein YbaP (TraB family)